MSRSKKSKQVAVSTQVRTKADTISDSQKKALFRGSFKYLWIAALDISVGLIVAFAGLLLLGALATSIVFYSIVAAAGAALVLANAMFWNTNFAQRREAQNLIHLLPWGGDEEVLEVGFGNAYYSAEAARRVTRGAVSTSEVWSYLKRMKIEDNGSEESASSNKAASKEAISGSPEPLPFKDGLFDAVVATVALPRYWKPSEKKLVIQDMSRVLKPGGWIGLLVLRNREEIAQALAESRFKDIETGKARSFILSSPSLVVARKRTNAEPITL